MNLSTILLFMSLFMLVFSGCSQNSFVVKRLNKNFLPAVKKEVAYNKEVLLVGKACFKEAKTLQEANACNDKVRKLHSDIEVEDFKKWDEQEKQELLEIIDADERYMDCMLEAKDIKEVLACEEPE